MQANKPPCANLMKEMQQEDFLPIWIFFLFVTPGEREREREGTKEIGCTHEPLSLDNIDGSGEKSMIKEGKKES